MTDKEKKLLKRIIAAAVLMVVLAVLPLKQYPVLRFVLFLIPYFTVGYDILRKAFKGIRNRQVFDENFLMAVATIGAMILGEYTEGVAVMLFYQIGELFQSIAVGKSRRNISELMDIRPDYANLETENGIEKTDPDEVEPGSVIIVEPGERVPIDGIVIDGASTLDTSALTGESLPRDVGKDEEVLSGSINLSGVLRVKTTKGFEDSTASRILDLVENAGSRKARSEKFIAKFARWYTPAVCYGALALAILGPVLSILLFKKPCEWALWSNWIFRALTFLVISCPCAIVVSIPLAFFGGIGGAGSKGILIKGANYMETLAKVRTVVFDKTGTLTKGNFVVTRICPAGAESVTPGHETKAADRLLKYAALVESHSNHPISRSLKEAYYRRTGKELDHPAAQTDGAAGPTGSWDNISNAEEISGKGVINEVNGERIAAGNLKLMKELGIEISPEDDHSSVETGTVVHVSVGSEYLGHIVISDEIKPNAAEALRRLKKDGVARTVMLTGDADGIARQVAAELGIDEYYAGLLPGDKVEKVESLLETGDEENKKHTLAFVGDGINDAPVLSRADIGIAMGALGSDAAIEAADVVLMDDDPGKIAEGIRIARKCLRIVHGNIWFAIGVKMACLILGALGIANMWLAIFADVGVMILCVLNSIRALV